MPCWRHEVEDHKEMAYRYQCRAENLEAALTNQSPPDATPAPNEDMTSWRSEADPLASEALGLYRRLARRAYKGKLGKSVPPWTLPRETSRILFSPGRFARRGQRSVEHDPMTPLSAPPH